MAITRLQTTKGATNGTTQISIATANFGASVTAGNLIVLVIRDSGGTISSVVDTLGTSYVQDVVNTSINPNMYVYHGIPASSGTNAVTVTWGATNSYRWVFAIEYSGAASSGVFDVGTTNQNSATDMVSGSFSTAVAGEVVVVGASQNGLTVYTAGTDFTLIDGSIGAEAQTFGGVEEFITVGTLSAYTAHITSDSANQGMVVSAAFRPPTAATADTGFAAPVLRSRMREW